MKPDISIIMPVYNSEKYLSSAIDSILEQSFTNYELILVDDGSKDTSGLICDEYSKKDSRIIALHKVNGGICSARNEGLKLAKGEYITFCDNDDKFLPGLLMDNYKLAKKNNVDLMRYSRAKRITNENGKVFQNHIIIPDTIIDKDYNDQYSVIRSSNAVWNALYRGDIIRKNNITFDESMRFGNEDLAFNLSILPFCKVLGFNSKVYYVWEMRNQHSTTAKFDKNYFSSLFKCLKLEEKYIKSLEGPVDPIVRAKCFTEQYVYPMIQHLNYKSAKIPFNKKSRFLSAFQRQAVFTGEDLKKYGIEVFKYNKKIYIILYLYLHRRYFMLLNMLKISDFIYSPFRFK
ncbi:Glycosyl transferase family 2 [Lachnospiraceae bacterium]|nr:Glycosyl transferase family 2 [Lachnospiraceae bacterium]